MNGERRFLRSMSFFGFLHKRVQFFHPFAVAEILEKVKNAKLPKGVTNEIVVVNDASTDSSIKIVESYKDSRIRLINYKKQLGLARIRQEGIKFAKGDLIAFQDCDDLSLPSRLTVQSNFLRKNLDIAMVGSWVKRKI